MGIATYKVAMESGTKVSDERKSFLYDKLLHSIYALVDNESELPALLGLMDEFFSLKHKDGLNSSHSEHMSGLLPHVQRANELLEKIAALHLKSNHADTVLDHIPMGIVLISTQASILSKNTRAADLLEHIGARHDTELHFNHSGRQKQFLETVKQVTSGEAHGAPLRMGDLSLWISNFGEGANRQLAIYLGHHTYRRNIRIDQLMTHYNLTEKEAQLTARLCDGHSSLKEAAERMGISIATARSHLKHIFAKTGAERQADLDKMVFINPILALQQKPPALQSGISSKTRVMRLPSGRTISYAEYGDPIGMPVLFCHAITGCRLMLPVESISRGKCGFRLIAPDRAGYGLSSPALQDPMQQWLEDMRHFLQQLGISECCVAGHSAGGVYAMALAVEYPDIVNHLCLISSIAPLRNLADAAHLLPINRMVIHLARSNPEAARAFLKLSMQAALKEPDSYLKLITNSSPDMDREVLEDAGLKQHLHEAFRETTRQGIGHIIDELMYISTRWRISAGAIACPVSIWHGKQDKHSPFTLIDRFRNRLKQVVHTSWMEGAGHYMLFHHWPAIENQLCPKKKAKPDAAIPAVLLAWVASLPLGQCLEFMIPTLDIA